MAGGSGEMRGDSLIQSDTWNLNLWLQKAFWNLSIPDQYLQLATACLC